MEAACASWAGSRLPVPPMGSTPSGVRGAAGPVLQGNGAARACLPRACAARSSTHTPDLHQLRSLERLEIREFQVHAARRKPPPVNVGCSRSALEPPDGPWFRDQPRFASPQPSSPASTSGDLLKKPSRMRHCRCGAQGSSGGEGDAPADERTSRAGSLESELFLYTGRMRALENFRAEVAKPDDEIDLVRAAVFVAQHLYPRVTAEEVEAEMEEMAAELEPLLPPSAERYTMRMINTMNKYLYERLGYKGTANYLDPDNSCINMVLKRREGLPLTMSLVYMELAKRVGLPMQGVNLPAHFMCRPTGDGLEFFIDAHANGKITFLQDAEERLSVVYGIPVEINPEFLKHTDITNRAFLLRLLFNLKRIYFERRDPVSTLCIIDYLKIVRPGVIEETRDYGICLYLLNRFSEAIPCLEAYIQEAPRATDAESMRSLLTKMRRDKMSG